MATKKKQPRKPLIHHEFLDPAIAAEVVAAGQAREASLLGDIKVMPEPQRAPLVPHKWWETRAEARAPIDWSRPIITVSPQVAEVLNIGIDRTVDLLKTVDDQLKSTQAFQRETEWRFSWTREFLRHVRDRIGPVEEGLTTIPEGGPQAFINDLARGVEEVLNEIENYVGVPMAGAEPRRR